ncbi:MAG: hypothetical protein ACD_80C00118G0021 [uncultured bacterium (gcode 4)]|uniref:Uncharacterized protein n=1 Tax=uncultured bacterium (gcode 4) TaxID=1234023 RepID=K1XIV4_9BACT|nr:MAG: hypothetical protein ACD_80C00118G0021 [uncultured bacterium (gcode 4)]
MNTLFEIIKWIFFFLTVVVGIVLLRGSVIFGPEYQLLIKQILMPGYLVFCGTMFWYIVARIQLGYEEDHPHQNKIYARSFIFGVVLGVILAVGYMFI